MMSSSIVHHYQSQHHHHNITTAPTLQANPQEATKSNGHDSIQQTTEALDKKKCSLKRQVSESSSSSREQEASSLHRSASSSPKKRVRTMTRETSSSSSSQWYYQPTQTRDLQSSFRIRRHVGEGTFGSVFLTVDRTTREPRVIKRVKTRDDKSVPVYGFPYTALREIKILQSLEQNQNVIKLHEVVTTEEHVFMVLEYMEYDLAAMLRLPELASRLTVNHVQSWTRQLLEGCQHLHSQQVLHRDLKPANLLVNKQGILKIGDFGLARKLTFVQQQFNNPNERKHTTSIGTPWYRAPEILIGSCGYDTKVDMWSTGCILFELGCRNYTVRPLFHASTGIDLCKQIDKKFASMRNDKTWLANEMVQARKDPVLEEDLMLGKLISKLLQIRSKLRLSAEDALKDEFLLLNDPEPILNMNFPRSSGHELDVMKFRQQLQQQQQENQPN